MHVRYAHENGLPRAPISDDTVRTRRGKTDPRTIRRLVMDVHP